MDQTAIIDIIAVFSPWKSGVGRPGPCSPLGMVFQPGELSLTGVLWGSVIRVVPKRGGLINSYGNAPSSGSCGTAERAVTTSNACIFLN